MATQTLTVSANGDDGHWYTGAGGLNLLGSNLLCGLVSGTYRAHTYIRWQLTADVAQGSTVNSSTLTVRRNYTGAPASGFSALAKFVDQASPSNPANVAAADALWSAAASGSGSPFNAIDWPDWNTDWTLDITDAFQDLVNARALAAGNYVMLILHDDGSTTYYRPFSAREAGTTNPTFFANWTAAPSGNRRRRALLAC
jgi:hypothetical protein